MKWLVWIVACLAVTGVCFNVTIIQPPIVTAALGENVTLPCHLKLSNHDRITTVLYWVYERNDKAKLWQPSGKYQGRVQMLDQNPDSLDKSIIFKNVQWDDKGKYLCKASITSQNKHSVRRKGPETELLVYGQIFFNSSGVLQCEVHVTKHSEFDLSISHNGHVLNSTSVLTTPSSMYSTLSTTISLRSYGAYKCDLNFNGQLLTTRTFGLPDPEEVEYPEPWLLYGGLILVQLLIFLALLTAMVAYSC